MRFLKDSVLVLAAVLGTVSGYGYQYHLNPYNGECRLQLNIPGGNGVKDAYRPGVVHKEHAYPGIMNTRYGSNDGQYHGNRVTGGSNYHGSASNHHSAVAGHLNHGSHFQSNGGVNHGSGSGRFPSSPNGGSYGGSSSEANYGSSAGNNFGGGSAGSAGGSYGNGGGSFGNNYGNGGSTSTNNYGSSESFGSSSNNFESQNHKHQGGVNSGGNYGGSGVISNHGNGNFGSSGNHGSSNVPFESSSNNNFHSSSNGHKGSSHGSSNRDTEREDVINNYRPLNNNQDGGSFGSASSNSNNYDRESSLVASSNRESAGSGSVFESASNNYGSSSSGNRGSSSSGNRNQGSSSGNRGSGGSYAGGSSSENYGNNVSGGNRRQQASNNNYAQTDYLDKVFAKEILAAHNEFRDRHNTPPVSLDEKISLKAQRWANELASRRVTFSHSPDAVKGNYGESLQVMNADDPTGTEVIDHWYKERRNYDYNSPNLVKSPKEFRNSHFTAILWKSTTHIGVGKATSKDGKTFIVVSYYPPGNIVDVLEDNVAPPRFSNLSKPRGPY